MSLTAADNKSMHHIVLIITHFIELHSSWIYGIVFLAAFTESIAIVGSVIPGGTVVAISGAFAVGTNLQLWILVLLAIIGSILGDMVSFYIGIKSKKYLALNAKIAKHKHLDYGKRFFEKHGPKSIIFGRFMGFTRAIIPLIAGLSDMDKTRFMLWNILGGITWAASHIFVGYFFGGSLSVISGWSKYVMIFVGAVGVFSIILWLLIKKAKSLVKYWYTILSGFCVDLLYNLTDAVLDNRPITLLDQRIHDVFLLVRDPGIIAFFKTVTVLGDWQIVIPVVVALALYLYYKNRQYVLPLLITVASSSAVTFVAKLFFDRPRPLDALLQEADSSFPSGHATIAIAFYGFIAFWLMTSWYTRKNEKSVVVFYATLIILLIGLSRLYLGVHYISDILAGYLVGSLGLLLGIYAFHRQKKAAQALHAKFIG